jgi:hypothetical protein
MIPTSSFLNYPRNSYLNDKVQSLHSMSSLEHKLGALGLWKTFARAGGTRNKPNWVREQGQEAPAYFINVKGSLGVHTKSLLPMS